jgi:hypothetical protein
MKTIFYFHTIFLLFFSGNFEDEKTMSGSDYMGFLEDISGSWEANIEGANLISILDYSSDQNKFISICKNELKDVSGKTIMNYEGVYYWNPNEKRLEFKTINNREIHSGHCKIKGDTLFHFGQISGPGSTKSYTSAFIKKEGDQLQYYATYSPSDTLPELKFENPFIYFKTK